jgi:hypothetical protein
VSILDAISRHFCYINVFNKLVNLAVPFNSWLLRTEKGCLHDKAAGVVLTSAKDFMKEFGKEQYMDVAGQLQKEEKKLKDRRMTRIPEIINPGQKSISQTKLPSSKK